MLPIHPLPLPVRPFSAGWESKRGGTLRHRPNANRTEQSDHLRSQNNNVNFVSRVSVQNLKHSEAPFSPLPLLLTHSSLLAAPLQNSYHHLFMLLPCVGAPLDGQFDLLRDEGRPCGHLCCALPLAALHTSLEAGGGPVPLRRAHPGLSGSRDPRPRTGGALHVQMVATALAPVVLRQGPVWSSRQLTAPSSTTATGHLLARCLLLSFPVLLFSVNAFYPEMGLQPGLLRSRGAHGLQARPGCSTDFTGSPAKVLLLLLLLL